VSAQQGLKGHLAAGDDGDVEEGLTGDSDVVRQRLPTAGSGRCSSWTEEGKFTTAW
jgi:hypothetical protein